MDSARILFPVFRPCLFGGIVFSFFIEISILNG
jgi:hypothetical protein